MRIFASVVAIMAFLTMVAAIVAVSMMNWTKMRTQSFLIGISLFKWAATARWLRVLTSAIGSHRLVAEMRASGTNAR